MVSGAALKEETQSKRRLKRLHPVASNRPNPPCLNYRTWCKGVRGGELVSRRLGNSRSLYIVCLCLHVFSPFEWEDGRDTHFANHTTLWFLMVLMGRSQD